MTDSEIRAAMTVALMAAFVDGLNDDRERASVKALAARIGEGRVDLVDVYEDVLARKVTIAQVSAALGSSEARRTAYEAAVAVADSDGSHTPAEADFLRELAQALGLPEGEADRYVAQADAIADAAVADAGQSTRPISGAVPRTPEAVRKVDGRLEPNEAELDQRIVSASITNAALELLPETLASMAILPLQIRLVYQIGKAYGYELDQGHIKELATTLGIGLTGQYLEQFGRRLLGGLLGGVLGGLGRSAGHQAASSGIAFATTWALGQIAKQYYRGNRTLDAASLKAAFAPLLDRGQEMVTRYLPEIQQRARTIDVRNLPALIRQT
jgi:uncharacterized protein (DUF697 family)